MRTRVRRRFGQHFLEAAWVRKLVELIAPAPGDRFLEIGPGRGALTLALAAAGARVLAVEIDRDLARELAASAPGEVEILEGDFLTIDPGQLAAAQPAQVIRVVGNLPYSVASPILRRLLDLYRAGAPFSDATLMLQREVAERVVARPPTRAYGPLAIMVQLSAEAERLLTLPPGAFRPVPRVQSAVVRLRFRPARVAVTSAAALDTVVRALFSRRRKTLGNAVRPLEAASGRPARDLLARAGLDPRRRPETLQLAELARLADVFAST